MARLVYRGGSPTDDNFTPRPGKDTIGQPGRTAGLSTFSTLERAVSPGAKAQVIDLDLLASPLQGFADDPDSEGGEEGHVSIAPATPDGDLDDSLLCEWAETRGMDRGHWLTDLLRQA